MGFGVDATEFFVSFEGSFQGQVYSGFSPPSPPPPVRFPQTVKPVKPFLNLSLKLFWTKWPMDLCRSGGSGGSITSQHGYAHHH